MIYGINQSIDNVYRFYFAPNNTAYICDGGNATDSGLVVYSSGASDGYNAPLGQHRSHQGERGRGRLQ